MIMYDATLKMIPKNDVQPGYRDVSEYASLKMVPKNDVRRWC